MKIKRKRMKTSKTPPDPKKQTSVENTLSPDGFNKNLPEKKDTTISVEPEKEDLAVETPDSKNEDTMISDTINNTDDCSTKENTELNDNFLNHNSADDLSLNIEKDNPFN